MDDNLNNKKEKIAQIIQMYSKKTQISTTQNSGKPQKKHKVVKYTCCGVGGISFIGIILEILGVLDANDIIAIIKLIPKIISFVFNIINNNAAYFSLVIIIIVIVVGICYCKKSDNSTSTIKKILKLFKKTINNNEENITITLNDGDKEWKITVSKENKNNNNKIVPFRKSDDLEVK